MSRPRHGTWSGVYMSKKRFCLSGRDRSFFTQLVSVALRPFRPAEDEGLRHPQRPACAAYAAYMIPNPIGCASRMRVKRPLCPSSSGPRPRRKNTINAGPSPVLAAHSPTTRNSFVHNSYPLTTSQWLLASTLVLHGQAQDTLLIFHSLPRSLALDCPTPTLARTADCLDYGRKDTQSRCTSVFLLTIF